MIMIMRSINETLVPVSPGPNAMPDLDGDRAESALLRRTNKQQYNNICVIYIYILRVCNIHLSLSLYIYIYTRILGVCVYIYIYICIYMYIHINVFAHMC